MKSYSTMAWNYFSTGYHSFYEKLVQLIREKNNVEVETTVSYAKHLCTVVDGSGSSLLHYAAEYGNGGITKFLIKTASNINLQDQRGQTPLIIATKAQHKYVIKILLESRADIYIRDNEGRSALQIAIHANPMHTNIVRLFVTQVIRDCSLMASLSAKKLMEAKCPLFKVALLKGTVSVLSFMVKEGSPIDEKDSQFGRTSLHVAVKNLDMAAVEFLVDAGADINAQDNSKQTPIAMCTDYTNQPSLKWKIIKKLIDKGTSLTTCTDVGVMQMYWILRYGNREAVKVVVESSVDFLARDNYGQTPLHYVASNINPGIVEALKNVEIGVDVRDKNGMTALHIGMAVGNFQFVEFLVRKGASVDVKTKAGLTPIFQAFESFPILGPIQHIKCIKFLLENGACPENEIQDYFAVFDTDSAVNRDFELLKPLVALLVQREYQGKLKFSEGIFQRIKLHPSLKSYADFCRANLNNETTFQALTTSDISNENGKTFIVYEDSESVMKKTRMERKCKVRMDVTVFEDLASDMEKVSMESKGKMYLNFSTLKTMSKRFCEGLEPKILDIFGTSIALIFVTAYAILCVAPPKK